jgi:hypothetical protein
VVRARQAVPYSRADVELLLDKDDAMRAVDTAAFYDTAGVPDVMRRIDAAARAAASAASQVRNPYPLNLNPKNFKPFRKTLKLTRAAT